MKPIPTSTCLPTPLPSVPLAGPLVEGRFVDRPNRFLVRVHLPEGARVEAHLPDPGRLRELLRPGVRVWLRPSGPSATRRTSWTAVLVETPDGRGLVSMDTTVPNRLVAVALEAGALEEFRGWNLERREAPVGRSRIDFLLSREGGRRLLLEVKSVTLVEDDGVARFPDAVTTRGTRHVGELRRAVESGAAEASILFVLQRADARRIEAARSIDPGFAEALERARDAGVTVAGRRCRVELDRVFLGGPVEAGVG